VTFTLDQIAAALGLAAQPPVPITGWSVDSRTVVPGDLFFALRGPLHDGNAYIDQAVSNGAAAVIGNDTVPDTLAALQQLAVFARDKWGGDVIGITGSAGKTSTKDVVASLLSSRFVVGKTEGNFNNHVGLPLSILRLPDNAQLAVLELGMNHAGEIRDLAKIARPRVGVVTNVGYAHIEFFESIDGIAAAKRELIEALPADGVAVLNADDPLVARFSDAHPGQIVMFGLQGVEVRFLAETTHFRVGDVWFETSLTGRHGIRNILAGIAVAGLYGIPPDELVEPVRLLQPAKMRGGRTWFNGIEIIDDCYNSNPDAAKSMVDVLRDTPATRRIAVLGEMLELGRWSGNLHREVGRYVAECGIDVLVGIRGAAQLMVDAAIDAGMPAAAAFFFDEPTEAGVLLRGMAREGDAILFKGSRGTHVERAIETFCSGATAGALQATS
jgi:UDP-N-acetylmuramoyl-tripeptide--D-alanyl-D-alanine ligase